MRNCRPQAAVALPSLIVAVLIKESGTAAIPRPFSRFRGSPLSFPKPGSDSRPLNLRAFRFRPQRTNAMIGTNAGSHRHSCPSPRLKKRSDIISPPPFHPFEPPCSDRPPIFSFFCSSPPGGPHRPSQRRSHSRILPPSIFASEANSFRPNYLLRQPKPNGVSISPPLIRRSFFFPLFNQEGQKWNVSGFPSSPVCYY